MKNSLINLTIVGTLFLIFVLGCGNLADKNTQTATPTASPVVKTEPVNTTAPANKAAPPKEVASGVTMANFNRIKTGMKYDEVVKILGKEGEVLSESDVAGYKTIMYKWDGDEGGFGANMNAMFQNGKLNTKSQFGLK